MAAPYSGKPYPDCDTLCEALRRSGRSPEPVDAAVSKYCAAGRSRALARRLAWPSSVDECSVTSNDCFIEWSQLRRPSRRGRPRGEMVHRPKPNRVLLMEPSSMVLGQNIDGWLSAMLVLEVWCQILQQVYQAAARWSVSNKEGRRGGDVEPLSRRAQRVRGIVTHGHQSRRFA